KARLGIEFVIAGIAVYFMMRTALASGISGSTFGSSIAFPFFKDFMINIGIIFVVCGGDHHRHDGKPVETVGQVDGIAG
ncbi:phospho-N-acetylmuramoyl-pentapeptide-transferase, partial [Rhizobium ruizarguesonis]